MLHLITFVKFKFGSDSFILDFSLTDIIQKTILNSYLVCLIILKLL